MADQCLRAAAHPAVGSALVPMRTDDDQVEAVPLGVLGERNRGVVAIDDVERQPSAACVGEAPGQAGPLGVRCTSKLCRRLGMSWTAQRDQDMDLTVELARQADSRPQCPLRVMRTVVADQEPVERATTPHVPSLLAAAHAPIHSPIGPRPARLYP